jgi:hypothetical protein
MLPADAHRVRAAQGGAEERTRHPELDVLLADRDGQGGHAEQPPPGVGVEGMGSR